MKALVCLAASAVLLAACAGVAFGQSSGDLEDALAAKGFDEAWIRSFGERWDALQARVRLPRATVDVVLGLYEPEWIPPDPVEAAGALHETAREAEIRRRQGEPLWRVAARLEHTLRQRAPASEGAGRAQGGDGATGRRRLEQWRSAREKAERGPESRPQPAGPGSGGGRTPTMGEGGR